MHGDVVELFPLGSPPWPTVDPFLFCVHHVDDYPPGNGRAGPAVPLEGRPPGQDFAGIDGWRMYHGTAVPGFPQHPHRGFETVTYVRRGLIDHADSLGATARYGRGDVQWLTAGRGIVHSETFPLLDEGERNPTELFQIWVNLAAGDKLVEPFFTMLWDRDIPRLVVGEDGSTTEVTVIAGTLAGRTPPPPPPHSWAARPDSDVAIWHIALAPDGRWVAPPAAGPDTIRAVYAFAGSAVTWGDGEIPPGHGAIVRADAPMGVASGGGSELLVLQGRPIGEPVARYGPFVMNDEAGIEQAFADYRSTGFGGWPWSSDEPVHGADPERFARILSPDRSAPEG